MTDPGLPLTTGEGNKPRQFHIRREHLLEGSALDVDPPFASLDVVLWRDYEAERERLLGRLADTETEKIERGTAILRLREQLDAARQALADVMPWLVVASDVPEQHWETLGRVRDAARAALGVEGPAE